ncbi:MULTISPECIES: hypothetical protein [unclassified Amycolatopsis]|uniref:hypothetical protein n=1 Tax=unclassified Amycolatopsis TaxID=2618356 RepID=UPI0028759D47|nr:MULTISPECIES: hypothetical protein [unclassified Amycolatopsis]MDS0135309.1 hypothetical protein [Amycolatopsis sp. 505]MDS0141000.1 hypothetical protein [Amycolatopsis sp. CM201R]
MPTLTELPRWTIRTSGDQATFTPTGHEAGAPGMPRGLVLREEDLPGFAKALGEVMKLPTYWTARARAGRLALDGEPAWSAPRRDPVDGFVHVDGPCHGSGDSFTVDLADVRALRVRIAAYLHQRGFEARSGG